MLFYSDQQIKEEVNNYNNLGFFKKSKNINVLLVFLIALFNYWYFQKYSPQPLDYSHLNFYVNLPLAIIALFIYFNHRWAMILICGIQVWALLEMLADPNFAITSIYEEGFLAVLAILITYRSVIVATKLNKK